MTTIQTKKKTPQSFWTTPIPGLTILTAMALWLIVTTVVPLVFVEQVPNALGLSLLFFNNLNILISACEIALGWNITFVRRDYAAHRRPRYGTARWRGVAAYLTTPLSLSTLGHGETWAVMWSTYALWDPSYQNRESFGFFVDVGNGWSSIPTCVLWNVVILLGLLPQSSLGNHLWLLCGVMGCATYWQVLYGTVIYFVSFFFNGRHIGRPWADTLGFVGVANGIWIVFPLLALYASVVMLRDRDVVTVFRQGTTAATTTTR